MKEEYIVSLDFVASDHIGASQLSDLIGVKETVLTSRPSQSFKNAIYWRFEPAIDDKTDVATGIELLNSSIQPQYPVKKGADIKDIYLSIAVIFDRFFGAVCLSSSILAPLASKLPDLGITITTYPTDEEDEDVSGFLRWYHRSQKEKGAPPFEIERDCVERYFAEWENMGRPGTD